jgi:hypothetical protein
VLICFNPGEAHVLSHAAGAYKSALTMDIRQSFSLRREVCSKLPKLAVYLGVYLRVDTDANLIGTRPSFK